MSNPPLNYKTVADIVLNGTYYNPASNHYNRQTSVTCDRCRRVDIDMCIGLNTYDLCLLCVQQVNNDLKTRPAVPEPQICIRPREDIIAMMMQRQFDPNPTYMTKMMQGDFYKK